MPQRDPTPRQGSQRRIGDPLVLTELGHEGTGGLGGRLGLRGRLRLGTGQQGWRGRGDGGLPVGDGDRDGDGDGDLLLGRNAAERQEQALRDGTAGIPRTLPHPFSPQNQGPFYSTDPILSPKTFPWQRPHPERAMAALFRPGRISWHPAPNLPRSSGFLSGSRGHQGPPPALKPGPLSGVLSPGAGSQGTQGMQIPGSQHPALRLEPPQAPQNQPILAAPRPSPPFSARFLPPQPLRAGRNATKPSEAQCFWGQEIRGSSCRV